MFQARQPERGPTPQARAAVEFRHHLTRMGAAGAPMLFCHGFGMDQTLWRLLAPEFQASHQVMLMDHVGSGRSDRAAYRRDTYASVDGYVDDVLEVCEVLDLRDTIFVGHSVSGMIGLRAALRAPGRFRCLVMLGASPRYLDDDGYQGGFTPADVDEMLAAFDLNRDAWAGHLSSAAAAQPDRPELAEEVKTQFLRAEPPILRQFARATFAVDARAELAACPVPVLLLQSRNDPIVPVWTSEYMAARMPAATLVFLASAGHFAQLAAPVEVAASMRRFLDGLEAG